jgi:hypothetical protein
MCVLILLFNSFIDRVKNDRDYVFWLLKKPCVFTMSRHCHYLRFILVSPPYDTCTFLDWSDSFR